MKIIITCLIIALSIGRANCQINPDDVYFDRFEVASNQAFKLFNIDKSLYLSLDMLKKENKDSLDKVSIYRFCINDTNGIFNVIYGYPNGDEFTQLFNYQCDTSFQFVKADNNYNTVTVNLLYKLAHEKEYFINKYVKKRTDLSYYFLFNRDTIELYILPSWQNSQYAVYGPEYIFRYSNNGLQLDSLISEREPLAFSIEKEAEDEIYLDYRNDESPSVGSIFFVMLYKEFFKEIFIETKKKKTYLINIDDFRWGHIRKE